MDRTQTGELSGGPLSPSKLSCVTGHRGVYLGYVPASDSTGAECITYCVEKVLDYCNVREALMRDAFVDIRPSHMVVYFVDEVCQVTGCKRYDLARISYCCGNHINDRRILSWIYRQEVDTGFQLECHAVRFDSEVKASNVASRLYMAFTSLYLELEKAVTCGGVMTSLHTSLVDDGKMGSKVSGSKRDSKRKPGTEGERRGSCVDNLAFDNIEEHCLGVEYDTDNVFIE